MKKYKILGQTKNGTVIAKTNIPMNDSGKAVKQFLIDMGWDGKTYLKFTDLIHCPFCKKITTMEKMKKHEHEGSVL